MKLGKIGLKGLVGAILILLISAMPVLIMAASSYGLGSPAHQPVKEGYDSVSGGEVEGKPEIPKGEHLCFRAGDVGLNGVRPIDDNGFLAAFVYTKLGRVYRDGGWVDLGYGWSVAQLSVEAKLVDTLSSTGSAGIYKAPILPRILRPETRLCVDVPLLPSNITLEEVAGSAPLGGKLAEFSLEGYRGYVLLSYVGTDEGGSLPYPSMIIGPQDVTTPERVLNIAGLARIASALVLLPIGGSMTVSFKSKAFDMSEYPTLPLPSWALWAAYTPLLDFPNGTLLLRFVLSNNTSPGYWYYVWINVYSESGFPLYFDTGQWVYVDGKRKVYVAREISLEGLGIADYPIKARIWLIGFGGEKRIIDGVIYAYVNTTTYLTEYVSIGAHEIKLLGVFGEYPHYTNGTYIRVPRVDPAPGHIAYTGQFTASLTYIYSGPSAPPSTLTIYAYYGGRLIGYAIAPREWDGEKWVYRFNYTSWYWMGDADRSVRDSLMLMGVDSDIIIGPFPVVGRLILPEGEAEGAVLLHHIELRGMLRPEMNRPLSALWTIYDINWMYVYVSEKGRLAIRLDVQGATIGEPTLVILLTPYKDRRTGYVTPKHDDIWIDVETSLRISGPIAKERYLSDTSVHELVEYISAFIEWINLVEGLLEGLASAVVSLVTFPAEDLLRSAIGGIDVTMIDSNSIRIHIDVGWAERKIAEGAYVKIPIAFETFGIQPYTVTVTNVTFYSPYMGRPKVIPVGGVGFVDSLIDGALAPVDKYRTLYCGYQEDLSQPGETWYCNRDAGR